MFFRNNYFNVSDDDRLNRHESNTFEIHINVKK